MSTLEPEQEVEQSQQAKYAKGGVARALAAATEPSAPAQPLANRSNAASVSAHAQHGTVHDATVTPDGSTAAVAQSPQQHGQKQARQAFEHAEQRNKHLKANGAFGPLRREQYPPGCILPDISQLLATNLAGKAGPEQSMQMSCGSADAALVRVASNSQLKAADWQDARDACSSGGPPQDVGAAQAAQDTSGAATGTVQASLGNSAPSGRQSGPGLLTASQEQGATLHEQRPAVRGAQMLLDGSAGSGGPVSHVPSSLQAPGMPMQHGSDSLLANGTGSCDAQARGSGQLTAKSVHFSGVPDGLGVQGACTVQRHVDACTASAPRHQGDSQQRNGQRHRSDEVQGREDGVKRARTQLH